MRSSGILLHISSLPGAYGVGTLEEADKFIAFLKAAKQSYWQILPTTPADFVNSPYSSCSAFAGNTLFIDSGELLKDGLVCEETIAQAKRAVGNDYVFAKQHKEIILREAFANFTRSNPPADFAEFTENAFWLKDFALYCALKKHFDGKCWAEWDEDARMRNPAALSAYAEKLSDEVDYVTFCQYVFFRQWKKFRQKLAANGIKLVGDIPIYVAYDSADVWANPQLFLLDKQRRPKSVAGVPPDYFSADGQLWGNPLYNWKAMKAEGYDWWLKRVANCAQMFDVLRIDHFRAFDSYYAIPYGATTARNGVWKKGVGAPFLKKIVESFPQLTVIAEDLGNIPQSVIALRQKVGMAGMKVVQFGFDGNPHNAFLPQNFEEHCVAYLGTHDNDTTLGWWNSLDDNGKRTVLRLLQLENGDNICHDMAERLAASNAELVVYSMQDVAEDRFGRMNVPGTLGCWKYMASNADFSNANAKWLAEITEKYDRCGR